MPYRPRASVESARRRRNCIFCISKAPRYMGPFASPALCRRTQHSIRRHVWTLCAFSGETKIRGDGPLNGAGVEISILAYAKEKAAQNPPHRRPGYLGDLGRVAPLCCNPLRRATTASDFGVSDTQHLVSPESIEVGSSLRSTGPASQLRADTKLQNKTVSRFDVKNIILLKNLEVMYPPPPPLG